MLSRTPGIRIKGWDVFRKRVKVEAKEFPALFLIRVKGIFRVVAGEPASHFSDNGSILDVALP